MDSEGRTPVVFFGHGSPTNTLETNATTQAWSAIARTVGRPKAILSVSAHWCTNRNTAVTAMTAPRTIHDFGRTLPAELFDIGYPAPGDPALAQRVRDLLAPISVKMDTSWGLDHGTWAILIKAYPQADIPVVQLSMDASKPTEWHFKMGRLLRPLRDEGVLIMASGNIVHNLSLMDWDPNSEPHDWATRFNELVKDAILRNDPQSLFDYEALGRDAVLSVMGPEHYWPLFYVLGARHDSDRVMFDLVDVQNQSLSMMTVVLDDRTRVHLARPQ